MKLQRRRFRQSFEHADSQKKKNQTKLETKAKTRTMKSHCTQFSSAFFFSIFQMMLFNCSQQKFSTIFVEKIAIFRFEKKWTCVSTSLSVPLICTAVSPFTFPVISICRCMAHPNESTAKERNEEKTLRLTARKKKQRRIESNVIANRKISDVEKLKGFSVNSNKNGITRGD